jgi:hypothetical protein
VAQWEIVQAVEVWADVGLWIFTFDGLDGMEPKLGNRALGALGASLERCAMTGVLLSAVKRLAATDCSQHRITKTSFLKKYS